MKRKEKPLRHEMELAAEIGRLKVKVLTLTEERDEARRAAENHYDDLVGEGYDAGRRSVLDEVTDCLGLLERIKRENAENKNDRGERVPFLSWGTQVALEETINVWRKTLTELKRIESQRRRYGHG